MRHFLERSWTAVAFPCFTAVNFLAVLNSTTREGAVIKWTEVFQSLIHLSIPLDPPSPPSLTRSSIFLAVSAKTQTSKVNPIRRMVVCKICHTSIIWNKIDFQRSGGKIRAHKMFKNTLPPPPSFLFYVKIVGTDACDSVTNKRFRYNENEIKSRLTLAGFLWVIFSHGDREIELTKLKAAVFSILLPRPAS